jgi:hypothetical protein
MSDITKYLNDLNQEILATASASEDGASRENVATRILLDILEESGCLESSPQVCYDRREDAAGRVMHRLSAYGLSDDGTSVDLFITTFHQHPAESGGPHTFGKTDLDKSMTQVTRFLESALKGLKDIEETAPVLSLAHHLATNRQDLLRANIFILTNGKAINSDAVNKEIRIRDVLVRYELWDIERFFRMHSSGTNREPIVIDFEQQHNHAVRCLPMPIDNQDYQTWLAIVPGVVLADLYQRHGQRLLERNVRAFLQFSTKVNKGIQKTIMEEPERFLAYNNGLAATASKVELTPDGSAILRIHDLQIVNGGQTTAAICQTRQQKRDAPLDRVFVQMKLTELSSSHNTDAFASLIAQFANTQNAIRQADLSANSPFNTALQQLSRDTWAPARDRTGKQSRWFFERARGQYKELKARAGTKQKEFESQNPPKQIFTKDMMAKYRLAWECRPDIVSKGGERVYAMFRAGLDEDQRPNRAWFTDLVALAILWREVEIFHTKNKLGDARNVVTAYTIAWLSNQTSVVDGKKLLTRLNLPDIWNQQGLSPALRQLLEAVIPRLDKFIRKSATGMITTEWGKKEASWEQVCKQGDFKLGVELAALRAELIPAGEIDARYATLDDAAIARKARIAQMRAELDDVGTEGWRRIAAWGNGFDSQRKRLIDDTEIRICDSCFIAAKRRAMPEVEVEIAYQILDRVFAVAPDILDGLEGAEGTGTDEPRPTSPVALRPVTLEVVEDLLKQLETNDKLSPDETLLLRRIAAKEQPLNPPTQAKVRYMQRKMEAETQTSRNTEKTTPEETAVYVYQAEQAN